MKLSIITSLYYSAPYIEEFYNRICSVAEKITKDYELVFVNDGSPDNSLEIAKSLYEKDKRVRIIDLSKNFGHHKAIMTGLAHSKGDIIFQIDIDLEEEPEILTTFYENYSKLDVDVVYGVQGLRKGRFFERISGALFYTIFNMFSSTKMPRNLLMARLMSRRYVDSLLLHKEREVALGGLWQITGFKQIPVVIQKLSKGTTTYNLYRRIGLSIKHITSFTNRPLILIAALGLLILFIAFLYLAYTLFVFFIIGETPSGFTSIILSIWFLGGLTIFSLGVIAVYLSVIFNEIKNRPLTIIKDIYERKNNGTNRKT